ncbi:MAG: hypothetical protein AAGG44_02400 [Planctomycetota bacterium]
MNEEFSPKSAVDIESTLQATMDLPAWFWILSLAVVLSFSTTLYLRERGQARRPLRFVLAILRCACILIVLWMLAGWTQIRYRVEKPELAMVIDSSSSMSTLESSPTNSTEQRIDQVKTALKSLPSSLATALTENYRLRWYTIDESLQPIQGNPLSGGALESIQATGSASRLGEGLSELVSRMAGGGSSAVLFWSDGVNTAGEGLESVERIARQSAVPIFPIAVGSDAVVPDIRIADLQLDRNVLLGDKVSIDIDVAVTAVSAGSINVRLLDGESEQVLDQAAISIAKDEKTLSTTLRFSPRVAGENRLIIRADSPIEEANDSNNQVETTVRVQDRPLRVLLVQQQPSYEFRFLKHLLERSRRRDAASATAFELSSVLQESDPEYVSQDDSAKRLVPSRQEQIAEFDAFIFGRFDPALISRRTQQAIVDAVTEKGAGCVFIYGAGDPQKELSGWPLETLLPLQPIENPKRTLPRNMLATEARWIPTPIGRSSAALQLGNDPEESAAIFEQLPIVRRAPQVGTLKIGAQVLAQSPLASGTLQPLLVAQFAGAGRVLFQGNDETFRWTTFTGSDVYHQRYWGQLLRWVGRGKLEQRLEQSTLSVTPTDVQLGQVVTIETLIGTDTESTRLPNLATVSISKEGYQETLTLQQDARSKRLYRAQTQRDEPGRYRVLLVQPTTDNAPNAEFNVAAPPGEQANLKTDLPALQSLATASRGRMVPLEEFPQLIERLPQGNAVRVGTLPPVSLWNSWWISLLFSLLLISEWLLRRHARML